MFRENNNRWVSLCDDVNDCDKWSFRTRAVTPQIVAEKKAKKTKKKKTLTFCCHGI